MSIADEIEKLHRLREQGALTEAEFAKAKAEILGGSSAGAPPGTSGMSDPLRNFFRSKNDRWLGGVCGGLGELTTVPSWVWRLLFCLVALFVGFGIIVYILMWIFVPERPA
jgi:phage shock protein PspC (stress-responsive transcriptional regulator)